LKIKDSFQTELSLSFIFTKNYWKWLCELAEILHYQAPHVNSGDKSKAVGSEVPTSDSSQFQFSDSRPTPTFRRISYLKW